jgi:hypothetical protein
MTGLAVYLPQSISTRRQTMKESVSYGPFPEKGRCQRISRFLVNALISTLLKLAEHFGSIPRTASLLLSKIEENYRRDAQKNSLILPSINFLQQGQLPTVRYVVI